MSSDAPALEIDLMSDWAVLPNFAWTSASSVPEVTSETNVPAASEVAPMEMVPSKVRSCPNSTSFKSAAVTKSTESYEMFNLELSSPPIESE